MSADLTAPSADQFKAFLQGDHASLLAIFRSRYNDLIAMAKESLGADLEHHSGRVAQQAMLGTWAQRASFQNPSGVASFLAEAVRAESAVQKKKHAALRQRDGAAAAPKHVSVPTVDEAVAQLQATLDAPPVDHDRARDESRMARKAHAAQHVQKVGASGGWVKPLLLVGGVGAALFAILKFADITGANSAIDKSLEADDTRDISARRGQRGNVPLSDGTKVQVGSDSHVKVPSNFAGVKFRTVGLAGSAEFTVAPGNPLPFEVRAGNAKIVATGTKFTVRAYPEDSTVAVGVTEGSVTVSLRKGKGEMKVAAGEGAFVAKDGAMSALTGDARDAAFSWTRDSLVFAGTPVSGVISELTRWFDSHPLLADPALGARPVTMRVGLASSGDALKALEAAAHLVVGFDKKDQVTLSDAPSAPAASAKKKK